MMDTADLARERAAVREQITPREGAVRASEQASQPGW